MTFQALTQPDTEAILERIRDDHWLTWFELRNCSITNIHLSSILSQLIHSQVKHISFQSQTFSTVHCGQLFEAINNNANIISLTLIKITLTAPGFQTLFQNLGSLEMLVFEESDIPSVFIPQLVQNFQRPESRLHSLNLSKNMNIGNELFTHLLQCDDRSLSKLRKLSLSDCALTDDGLRLFAMILTRESCQLEEIDLSSNPKITVIGVKNLCLGLSDRRSSFLSHLSLGDCELDNACLIEICKVLPRLKLKSLFLDSNDFTDDIVCNELTVALETNGYLETVYLDGNIEISDRSIPRLFQSLKTHPRLFVFSLEDTEVSDQLKFQIENLLHFQQNFIVRLMVIICSVYDVPRIGSLSQHCPFTTVISKDLWEKKIALSLAQMVAVV